MSTDREAVEAAVRAKCERGEYEDAATLAVREYGREVLRFLMSRLRDDDAAAEVFSVLAEDLWRGLPAFEWRCSLRTWAYTLARHAACRHVSSARRHRARHVALSQATAVSRAAMQVRTETLAVQRTSNKNRLSALRDQLPPEDRELLVLRVNRRLDWREIAHVVLYEGDRPSDAQIDREAARLRKRFQIVKERLRKMAEEQGLVGQDAD
jgi:RNA polymerase sigma-70 factor (ECF subfamily)